MALRSLLTGGRIKPAGQYSDDFRFCQEYLAKVSRTFSLNISVLHGDVYRAVLLAYLLCRIADILEDEDHFSPNFKVQKLLQYSDLFPPAKEYRSRIALFLEDITFPEETDYAVLLMNSRRVFDETVSLPDRMIAVISQYVREMAAGMAGFQQRNADRPIAFLEDQQELEQYCYYVAGTVGRMLTGLFAAGSKKITAPIEEELRKHSVAFGLGLQITNIVKDFFGDRERGWYYIPRSFFLEAGVDPIQDSIAQNPKAFYAVQERIIAIALEYLDEALQYTLKMPRTLVRYRIFCLWPLFMAVETLSKLHQAQSVLDPHVVKLSRDELKHIMATTALAAMSNQTLIQMYQTARDQIT
ncbi:MAG TPA: squalene/phytoene synthase family protein [Thermodesulfobacteriota bacterium]|nr:squalene/phytoene synthase family protein [Deltaproteobacteria bacterium]HNR14268.1 squalene/phytoene synthase family protein [Thermodesulfobacteriota bacterium]HNU70907.1 squalene/phytoene synthase family protein [Thermodesulfobacteriota bacterium]HOC38206.1 squalene/phytoene synthase family protein [Thermodesulfobacteriota bacterium]HQO79192.1 squalene/phytoene synthase family protein [Thermodesulfobacteriota bacterium]